MALSGVLLAVVVAGIALIRCCCRHYNNMKTIPENAPVQNGTTEHKSGSMSGGTTIITVKSVSNGIKSSRSMYSKPSTSESPTEEDIEGYYQDRLDELTKRAEERELALRRDFGKKLDLIEKKYNELRDQFDDNLLQERNEVKKKLRAEYELQLRNLREENETLENDVSALRKKLHSVLQNGAAQGTSGEEGEGGVKMRNNENKLLTQITRLKHELGEREKATKEAQQQVNDVITKMGNMRRQLEEARQELHIREKLISELEDKLTSVMEDQGQAPRRKPKLEQIDSVEQIGEEIQQWKENLDKHIENKVRKENQTKMEATNTAFDALRIKELEEQVKGLEVELQQQKEQAVARTQADNREKQAPPDAKSLSTVSMEAKVMLLLDRNQELETRMQTKDSQIDNLQQRLHQLMVEMDEKMEGIREFSSKTEEYIKSREKQQTETYERLIDTIKSEHQKELENVRMQMQEHDFRQTLQTVASMNLASPESCEREREMFMNGNRPLAYMAGSLDRNRHNKTSNSSTTGYEVGCSDSRVSEWVFNCDPSMEEIDSAIWQGGTATVSGGNLLKKSNSATALEELSHILASKDELRRRMRAKMGDPMDPKPSSPTPGSRIASRLSSLVTSVASSTRARAASLTRSKPPSGRPPAPAKKA